jgi:hyperosmotically inducible protein
VGVDRKILVFGIALASAMAVGGCSSHPDQATASAATTAAGAELEDAVVAARVNAALLANPGLKGFDLQAQTHKGVTRLSGLVDNQTQIASAYSSARGVEGVGRVESDVHLKGASTSIGSAASDDTITAKLKLALLADPKLKSFDIAVVTHKGAVHLSGFVKSQIQIAQAVAIAHKVEGVKSVADEMSIKASRT